MSFAATPPVAAVPSRSEGKTEVSVRIERALAADGALQAAHWGFLVQDESGRTLYARDAHRLFNPASNMKLLTGAAALTLLGPQYQFRTRLRSAEAVDDSGVLHGSLYLQGGGDPSLTTTDLASAVQALALQRIETGVAVDDTAFDTVRLGPGWAWDDLSSDYSAEIDAVCLDENVVHIQVDANQAMLTPPTAYLHLDNQVKPGDKTDIDAERAMGTNNVTLTGTVSATTPADVSVTMLDPALYAADTLLSLCQRRGIDVAGGVSRARCPENGPVLWEKTSDSLLLLASHMLKESDNVYAEVFFRALAGGHSDAAPQLELNTLHLDGPCHVVDGSGLSRYDLLSPYQLATLVRRFYASDAMMSTLPVASVDGTLKKRMPELKGRVHAKTGTLTAVSTLSGWLVLKDGRRVAFSWMCNNYPGTEQAIKATEDRLIIALDAALER